MVAEEIYENNKHKDNYHSLLKQTSLCTRSKTRQQWNNPSTIGGGEKQVHKVKNQTPKTIPKLLLNISSAELQWSLTQQTNVQNVNGGATASQFMRLVFALRPN